MPLALALALCLALALHKLRRLVPALRGDRACGLGGVSVALGDDRACGLGGVCVALGDGRFSPVAPESPLVLRTQILTKGLHHMLGMC